MVLDGGDNVSDGIHTRKLKLPVFGFTVAFTEEQDISGKFGNQARAGSLLRFRDFSLPQNFRDNLMARLCAALHQCLCAALSRR